MDRLEEIKKLAENQGVLYVEDSSVVRETTEHLLKSLFGKVFIGSNGQEGLELFNSHTDKIDLIISDIQMPKLSGLDMVRKIRETDEGIHVMILSAHHDVNLYADAVDIGVDGFIAKPIDREKFLKAIFRAVRSINDRKSQAVYQQEIEKLLTERTCELDKLLVTDDMTGLPNKTRLEFELSGEVPAFLLLVNIDNFDHINSTYGYEMGDKVLCGLARLLEKILPDNGRLYRLPSDEMAFFLVTTDQEEVKNFAAKVLTSVSEHSIIIDDIEMHITCTIGIARGSGKKLLMDAHLAMKEVREKGKNRYGFFDEATSALRKKQKNNIQWFRKVKKALEDNLVIPFFQPIVNNATGKIEKYECLARIVENERIITPDQFIDPARLVGMLPNITKIMIEKCFAFFADRQDDFSINITEYDLKDGYLIDFIEEKSRAHNLRKDRIVLEILENISAQGSEDALKQLLQLKAMGIKLALDDFGSEKSNFYRLQELQVDFIKIDGSFIKNIHQNENCYKIAKTIKLMSESLGAKAIAEFVCDKNVFEKVKELNIEYSQGYFFGQPLEFTVNN